MIKATSLDSFKLNQEKISNEQNAYIKEDSSTSSSFLSSQLNGLFSTYISNGSRQLAEMGGEKCFSKNFIKSPTNTYLVNPTMMASIEHLIGIPYKILKGEEIDYPYEQAITLASTCVNVIFSIFIYKTLEKYVHKSPLVVSLVAAPLNHAVSYGIDRLITDENKNKNYSEHIEDIAFGYLGSVSAIYAEKAHKSLKASGYSVEVKGASFLMTGFIQHIFNQIPKEIYQYLK